MKRLLYFLFTKIIYKPGFIKQFYQFRSLQNNNSKAKWIDILPYLNDNTKNTGFDTHYIYHPAWATRVIKKINPNHHVDISSTLHFCTMLSAFIPTKFYDYRPAKLNLSDLESDKVDLCNMHFKDESISSLSCMHTIEHIGLGRYGDPIDPEGDIKAAKELQRVLAENGNLLIVTPVGKPRIQFNAHRVYSFEQVVSMFHLLKLESFSLIPDNAFEQGILEEADPALVALQKYGCGCFLFRKVKSKI